VISFQTHLGNSVGKTEVAAAAAAALLIFFFYLFLVIYQFCPCSKLSFPLPVFITSSRTVGLFTHADESHGSKAFICDSVCAFVCLSVCPHDLNQNGWKYNHQTCHRDSPSWVLATHLILGQKVKGQGHRITKCKTYFRRSSEFALYHCAHRLVNTNNGAVLNYILSNYREMFNRAYSCAQC